MFTIFATFSFFLSSCVTDWGVIYSFLPRGFPASHFWNLMLTMSETFYLSSASVLDIVQIDVTSLGSSLLGLTLESSTHSSGSNVRELDVAENYSGIRLISKLFYKLLLTWDQQPSRKTWWWSDVKNVWWAASIWSSSWLRLDWHLETLPNRSSAWIEDDCSFTDHVYTHQNKLKVINMTTLFLNP